MKVTAADQRAILATKTYTELQVILNKYCARDSVLISQKKFGFVFDKELVEEEIMERVLFGYAND